MSNGVMCNQFKVEEDTVNFIDIEKAIDEIEHVINEENNVDKIVEEKKNKTRHFNDAMIKRRYLTLIKQDINREKNMASGWANPDLTSGRTLDEEVFYYQKIYSACGRSDSQYLQDELNQSFQHIAGYYCNFEYRWYRKMNRCFDSPDCFYDFYYDLLRDCIIKFSPEEKKSIDHNVNYRKANKECHFNQYFFGALEKRKISKIKRRFATKRYPSIVCEVCGELVTKISDFHLKHVYDENRIKKEFKIVPVSMVVDEKKVRYYELCPICGEMNVPVAHVKKHSYAEKMTVHEYSEKFPFAKLSAAVVSLQEKLPGSDENSGATLEDVYASLSMMIKNELDLNSYVEHIQYVFRDNQFLAQVMKLKLMRYRNNEIAEEIGCKVAKVNSAISKMKRNKRILSELFPNVYKRTFGWPSK